MRVWITGASSGIGEALARELHRRGAALFLTARSADKLERLAAELPGAVAEPADVTDRDAILEIGARIAPVDIAVLGAGAWEPITPDNFSAEIFRREIDVNYMGVVHGIEAVLQDMRRRHTGRIAVVGSVVGFKGLTKAESYGATKAALLSLCDSLRADLADDGVDVTYVAPGFVRTPLTDSNDFEMPFLIEPDEAARAIADGLARGRAEIVFPRQMAIAMKLLRVLPGGVSRAVSVRLSRRQRRA